MNSAQVAEPPAPAFKISMVATFTAEPMRAGLEFWLSELGLPAEIEQAGYGQVIPELLDPSGVLTRARGGAALVLVRVRDWLREQPEDVAGSLERATRHLDDVAAELVRAAKAHRAQAATEQTLLLICPSTLDRPDMLDEPIEAIERRIVAELDGVAGLIVVRAVELHRVYGVDPDAIHDRLRDDIGHIPFRQPYLHVLATIAMRWLYRRFLPLRKVVVVDCDNTLWRGVVGEEGWRGISLDPAHRALQEFLVRLSESGILVCLCSKNAEADVWEAFDRREDFPLRRDHIVAAAINWQSKSDNLKMLAARLNLGLDSFVFLDDNPVECAEVRAHCPEVLTLEWPQRGEDALALLDHIWDLDVGRGTDEDRKRTQLYRDEYTRKALLEEAPSFDDFLESLQLEIEVERVSEATLARASQMTMRTNQFNCTTIRRTEVEIQNLLEDPAHEVRIFRVRDRFGDYGIVGLVIARADVAELEVDTFLLSCRVLGRGVEHRMINELGHIAAQRGLDEVVMRVETTRKNRPARAFLESIAAEGRVETSSDALLACRFTADALRTLRRRPSVAADDDAGASGKQAEAAAGPASDALATRARERQIARAAYQLSRPDLLAAAIGGPGAKSAARHRAHAREDVARIVYSVFESVLGRPAEEIAAIDELEALDCDSLKIVDITVELIGEFPNLPSTLLFEHRSVSGIVAAIAALSDAPARHVPAVRRSPGASEGSSDVAVVGIALRCAGASSPDELWRMLRAGATGVGPVPPDREYFFGRLEDDRGHWAGLLEDVDMFDAEFFGVSPNEARSMDPQQRLFMEVAFEALEDAGLAGGRGTTETGVYVGIMYGDYVTAANRAAARTQNPYRSWEGFSLANRLSQFMGYTGPSLAIDTACSSSGMALHQARLALAAGDCRVAVVGGLNLILDPGRFVQLGRLGILSKSGRCRPFGAEADGTVLGEGVGVVVLKPLKDALDDGDRIYGVIKGTGASTGAGTVGFTAPNPHAQAVAIGHALRASGIDPRTISYVETHGTGTALGDPIEVRGLSLAYESPEYHDETLEISADIRIGSIKPNVGHLEAGAGIIGLIKVLLQLEHGELLPSLTSEVANPQIPFTNGPFSVQRRPEPWKRPTARRGGRVETLPRRAGISSFGVGGSNVHIIVEEAPEVARQGVADGPDRPAHVLLLSAPNSRGLLRQAAVLRDHLCARPELSLADACHVLATRRRHFAHRAAIVVDSREAAIAELDRVALQRSQRALTGVASRSRSRRRVAFLFTGQGAQYAGMGRELHETQPVFRAAFDRCAAVLDPLLGCSLHDLVFTANDGRLDETRFTQPGLFALQWSLAELWRSWGVEPVAVLGHSVGEFAALCVAGGLSVEDGARLIEARGRLIQSLPTGGGMVSVRSDEATVRRVLAEASGSAEVAAVNGPDQIVISGRLDALAPIVSRLQAAGHDCKQLVVSHAFHSRLMEPAVEALGEVAASVEHAPVQIPFVSSMDGMEKRCVDAGYWKAQLRSEVRFADAFARLAAEHDVDAYIEIGPHPVLLGLARQCLPRSDVHWLPSLRRGEAAWPTLLESLARWHVEGGEVDWEGFDGPYARRVPTLPAYSFERRSFWIEPGDALDEPLAVSMPPRRQASLRYEVVWRDVDASTTTFASEQKGETRRRWIFLADARLARALAARLPESDRAVEVADLGNPAAMAAALERSSADASTIVIARGEGIGATTAGDEPDAASLVAAVVAAARPAIEHGAPSRIFILTRGAVDAGDANPALDVGGAALWGLGRVLALEHPDRWGGLIDLDPTVSPEAQAERLVHILSGRGEESQLALRAGKLLAPRLVPVEEARGSSVPLVRADASYLITGGAGAIGRACARWLATSGAGRIVLASRRSVSTPSIQELAAELAAQGTEVELVAADVTSAADVERLITTADSPDRPLRGVFHAAGLEARAPIRDLHRDAVHRIVEPKARGAWYLHEATRTLELDHFVCFSSMAALVGSTGRAHYAAANAYLDGLVSRRRASGLPGLAIGWGPWLGGGMATDEELAELERIGNRGLRPDRALTELGRAMRGRAAYAAVMDIDWSRFKPVLEARRRLPLIAEVGAERAPQAASGATLDADALRDLPAEQREQRLIALVRVEVARTLGFADAEEVDIDSDYFDLGLDSLRAVELAAALETHLGEKGAAAVYEHPTVRSLVRYVLALQASEAAHGEDDTEARADSPAQAAASGKGEASVGLAADAPSGDAAVGIVGYAPHLEREIIDFQYKAWPQRRSAAEVWRWMFLDSARRLERPPEMWFYRDRDSIVGETGAIPVRLKVGADDVDSAWFVDSMVLEGYRQRAVGSRILARAMKDRPFALSLGQEAYMREILLKTGWQVISPLAHFVYPIRARSLIDGKLPPGPIAWTGANLLDAAVRLRRLAGLRQSAAITEVASVERFAAAHDALWARVSMDLQCAVVRDASFLNWKYVDRPGARFHRLELRRDGEPVAVAVLSVIEPGRTYRYRRAFIVDLVLPPKDSGIVQATLEAVRAHCAELGADALHAFVISEPLSRELARFGFIEREATRYLMATINGISDAHARIVTEARNWFCTMGDSDLDSVTVARDEVRAALSEPG